MRATKMADVARASTAIPAHPIPDAALANHTAIVGKTGSGKSYAAKGVIERLLARDERVAIVDPTGVYWGLRLAPDGQTASAFAPVIFGGRHADLPLAADAGARLAAIVGGSTTPVILDTQLMSVGERTRMFTAFAEALLRENQGPLTLVLDEAHLFAPQGGAAAGGFETAKLLHATNNLVALGRSAGLRILLITQRPAKLHKDALTQVETLVALRVTSPQDRKAVADWLAGAPALAQSADIIPTLASLRTGEGWVYAPEQGVLERATFPPIATFDSGRPLAAGSIRMLEPIDVAGLRQALMADVGASEPDDETSPPPPSVPARHNRQQSAAEAATKRDGIEAAEQRGYERGVRAAADRIYGFELLFEPPGRPAATIEQMDRQPIGNLFAGRILALLDGSAVEHQPGLQVAGSTLPTVSPALTRHPPQNRREAAQRRAQGRSDPAPTTSGAASARSDGPNSAGRKMLAVLDTDPPVRRSWQQVATLAGLKARGGHFNAGRKALVDAGLVDERSGLVAIVEPSADAQPEMRDPLALAEMWRKVLSGAAPKILRALFVAKRPMTRAAIAEDLGMQPRGGHWNAGWKELRDNGLVAIEGELAQLSDLFITPRQGP